MRTIEHFQRTTSQNRGESKLTLFYYDPIFQEHDTGDHPENGGRILSAVRHLSFVALDSSCTRPAWDSVTVDRLCYVHARQYIESVQRYASGGGGYFEGDTVVSEKSYQVACSAAGAVCDAVTRVVGGDDKTAFCLVRPPGHHAMPGHARGFCLFNNVAVGSRVASRELGIERVLIIDFDVHHGDGTQEIFWEDPNVGFFSMHRSPFYPGTGTEDEVGAGDGQGTTFNLPIEFGTSRVKQLSLFEDQLNAFAAKIRPQLVLLSAGFDGHRNDPIGSLGLESDDFRALTRCVMNVADQFADGKLVSVLEGGYNPNALSECIETHLEELLGL